MSYRHCLVEYNLTIVKLTYKTTFHKLIHVLHWSYNDNHIYIKQKLICIVKQNIFIFNISSSRIYSFIFIAYLAKIVVKILTKNLFKNTVFKRKFLAMAYLLLRQHLPTILWPFFPFDLCKNNLRNVDYWFTKTWKTCFMISFISSLAKTTCSHFIMIFRGMLFQSTYECQSIIISIKL